MKRPTLTPATAASPWVRGGWRIAGYLLALAAAALGVALLAVSAPTALSTTRLVCTAPDSCASWQVTPQLAATLQRNGISLGTYAAVAFALMVVSSLGWAVAGAIILARGGGDRVALLVGIQAITQGATSASTYITDPQSVWYVLATALGIINQVALFYVFALFPSGTFVPRWLRWAGLGWIAVQPIGMVPLGLDWLSLPLYMAALVLLVGSQIYRYRRASNAVQRQQTKLVVFAFATMVAVIVGVLVPGIFNPSLIAPGSLYTIGASYVTTLVLLLGPISLVVAILRYRLFEIDIIIRRTLVYGTLTAILAAVYFACVVGGQALAQALTGERSLPPAAVVASTLMVAALFQPLRGRLQRFIDRRFYRGKYDAAKTLASFGHVLRQEVDLPALEGRLLAVVEGTMQPAHLSLWLRPPQVTAAQVAPEGIVRAEPPHVGGGR